jgi:hypothetical protein
MIRPTYIDIISPSASYLPGDGHYGAHFDVVIFLCRVKSDQRVKEHPNLAGLAAMLTKSRRRVKYLRCILQNKRPGSFPGLIFCAEDLMD